MRLALLALLSSLLTLALAACGQAASPAAQSAPGAPTSQAPAAAAPTAARASPAPTPTLAPSPTPRPVSRPAAPPAATSGTTPTGGQTPAALPPLISKALEPSTSAQTLSWKDQVTVSIPGGTLGSKQTLTISPAPALPPPTFKGLAGLGGGFDISMGDVREFKNDLIIEIAYDPAKIKSDLPPEKALVAMSWDPAQKIWTTERSVVDTQRRVVIIRTNHLSVKQLEYIPPGWTVHETEHFIVVYDPKEKGEVMEPSLKKASGGFITHQVPSKKLAEDMGSYLEHAWDKYANYETTGFRMPLGDWKEGARLWVFVDPTVKHAHKANFSDDLYVPTKWDDTQYKDGSDQMRHESAHELFHAVQNRYFNLLQMDARRWWMEATADYAADAIAWGGAGTMPLVPATYFGKSITTVGGFHEYKTSRFVAYLARPAGSFKRMWDYVAKETSTVPFFIDKYLKEQRKSSLEKEFRDFVAYVLFDAKGPLSHTLIDDEAEKPVMDKGLLNSPAIERPDTLAADKTELRHGFHQLDSYTASVWGFRVKTQAGQQRRLTLERPAFEDSTQVLDVYVLKNDSRPEGGVKPEGSLISCPPAARLSCPSLKMDLRPVDNDDVVYIVNSNGGVGTGSLSVKVTEAAGKWVLVKRTVSNEENILKGDPTPTVSGNTANVTYANSSWTCSWPEPPQTLEFGQKWGGTLTVRDAGSKPYPRGARQEPTLRGEPHGELRIGMGVLHTEAFGTVPPAPGESSTQSFSWTIPQDALNINVSCLATALSSDGRYSRRDIVARVEYMYELRK